MRGRSSCNFIGLNSLVELRFANLTFFHSDFGKEFPSRTFWRGPSRDCPSPSSVMCPLLYTAEQSTFRGGEKGEKVPRKGEEEGGQQRGQKGKKDARKQVSNANKFYLREFIAMCFLTVSSRPCLETNPHSILRTPRTGHCSGGF